MILRAILAVPCYW